MNDAEEPADPAYLQAKEILERLARGDSLVRSDAAAGVNEEPPAASTAQEEKEAAPVNIPRDWAAATLRRLLESLPDSLVVIDQNGTIVLMNTRTEELFGYRPEELLGQVIEVLIPARFRPAHEGQRVGYFAAPRVRPMGAGMELYGRRKNGTEVAIEISLSPLQTEHGPLVTAVIHDISQRQREQAKFRTLVENIPAVTFIAPLDEALPEFYVSPQIEQLLGFSQKEWLEDPILWFRQLHPDDRERWNREFAPTCVAGTSFRSVYRFLARDGRVVWVHGFAQLVRSGDGQPLFLQGVAFDITAIKEAEGAVHQLNLELERRVQERTATLQEQARELSELNAALIRSNNDLDDFADITAHDLKEPLRGIQNYAGLLIEDYAEKLDADGRHKLVTLGRLSERMLQLIDSLHQFSRVGRVDLAIEPTNLDDLVLEVLEALHVLLETAAVEVRKPRPLPTILCDHVRVREVFYNLIINAVKYNDKPVKWVEIGFQEPGVPAAPVVFCVRDNGIGIPQKHRETVFRMFKRLHGGNDFGGGTGVGLTIAKKIVERHHGRIWIESVPGEGTTFFFTLSAPP